MRAKEMVPNGIYAQSPVLASRAPSTSAPNLAHMISGWTRVRPADVPKPQSVPAMTFSRPTSRAYCSIRWATSSGCSTKLVAESITPGIRTLPGGRVTSSQTCHSWAWRGLAASIE